MSRCPMCDDVSPGIHLIKLCDTHKKVSFERTARSATYVKRTKKKTVKHLTLEECDAILSSGLSPDDFKKLYNLPIQRPDLNLEEFLKEFESDVSPEIEKNMLEILDESEELRMHNEEKSEFMHRILKDLYDALNKEDAAEQDTSAEVLLVCNQRNKYKRLKHVIPESDKESEDETFVMKVKNKKTKERKVDHLDSEEDEVKKSDERTRKRKRKMRIAAEVAQFELDEASDAEKRNYIENIQTSRMLDGEWKAAINARIAKALADKQQECTDDMVDKSVQGLCSDSSEFENIEEDIEEVVDVVEKAPCNIRASDFFLIRDILLDDDEKKSSFTGWLRLFANVQGSEYASTKWYNKLRTFFPFLADVPEDILSQAALAKIVAKRGFDMWKWQDRIRNHYCIRAVVPDENLLEAVLIQISIIFARRPEVHEWILCTE